MSEVFLALPPEKYIERIRSRNSVEINMQQLKAVDIGVFNAIAREKIRQHEHIELIASENFVSQAVLDAVGSVLTNKYAEGYPQRRYYGGCENVDTIEQLAVQRAQMLFGAEHINVQPHSGSQANFAVYTAVLKPGDKILTLSLQNGGHLTHGHPKNISGMLYDVLHYDVSAHTGLIDYDQMAKIARNEHPKLITIGASAYSRAIDFKLVSEIARSCGALVLADIAHIAGLVAVGLHQSPVPHCDFVTTTTHKTLRGPRGGMVMCRKEFAKAIDSALFPGTQGGPLMHVIAGKAVCFLEALRPEFAAYQRQVVKNAAIMANRMLEHGYHVVSGGTDNHLMLVDLRTVHENITGHDAEIALESAHITTNRNTVPNETRSPLQASGLRLGTPAVTSRGMGEAEMVHIADLMASVLSNIADESAIASAREKVGLLCSNFPLRY